MKLLRTRWMEITMGVVLLSGVLVSCLTTEEKARWQAAETRVSLLEKEKASEQKKAADVTSSEEQRGAAEAKVKEITGTLIEAQKKAEEEREIARSIRMERGVQIAQWATAGLKQVLPFIPYGEVLAPIVSMGGLLAVSLMTKKKEDANAGT